MTYSELAEKIATEAFSDKVDLSGEPYILHLRRVASNFIEDDELCSTAWLHDILEDCKAWTGDRLKALFPMKVVCDVLYLTRNKGESYEDYIYDISSVDSARRIKLADLKDNMDITRLKSLTEKDILRLKKYHKAFLYLKSKQI